MGLKFHLNQFEDRALSIDEQIAGTDLSDALDRRIHLQLPTLSVKGRLQYLNPDVLAAAQFSGAVECACTRCLEPFWGTVDGDFTLLLHPRPAGQKPSDPLDEDEESPDEDFFDNDEIPFGELVREQVALALPAHPICRPDCAGLCPDCGTDLNKDPCLCKEKKLDPRWSALAGIKIPN